MQTAITHSYHATNRAFGVAMIASVAGVGGGKIWGSPKSPKSLTMPRQPR